MQRIPEPIEVTRDWRRPTAMATAVALAVDGQRSSKLVAALSRTSTTLLFFSVVLVGLVLVSARWITTLQASLPTTAAIPAAAAAALHPKTQHPNPSRWSPSRAPPPPPPATYSISCPTPSLRPNLSHPAKARESSQTLSLALSASSSSCCSSPDPPPAAAAPSSSNSSCPSYFRFIHEDLRPWRAAGGVTRAMLARARVTASFRLVVLRGRAFVQRFRPAFQTRDLFTIWGILQLLRRYPGRVPDLDLMFDCVDWPVVRTHLYRGKHAHLMPPLFRYSGIKGPWISSSRIGHFGAGNYASQICILYEFEISMNYFLILYASSLINNYEDGIHIICLSLITFGSEKRSNNGQLSMRTSMTLKLNRPEINIKPWDALQNDLKNGNSRVTWSKREPYAYWKGNAAVAVSRQELVKCNISSTQDWNARIYTQDWFKESKEGYKNSDLGSQCTHRYKIYIEGSAWSISQKYILACDSMTLLVTPKYYDFFSRSLVPIQHYWPVRDDNKCASIKYAVEWGNSHKQSVPSVYQHRNLYAYDTSVSDPCPTSDPAACHRFDLCMDGLMCNVVRESYVNRRTHSSSPTSIYIFMQIKLSMLTISMEMRNYCSWVFLPYAKNK